MTQMAAASTLDRMYPTCWQAGCCEVPISEDAALSLKLLQEAVTEGDTATLLDWMTHMSVFTSWDKGVGDR